LKTKTNKLYYTVTHFFLRSYASIYTQTVSREGGQMAQLWPLFQSVVDRSSLWLLYFRWSSVQELLLII